MPSPPVVPSSGAVGEVVPPSGLAVAAGVGLAVGLGVVVGVGLAVGLGEGLACAAVTLSVRLVRQVTVAPPPLPEPLHWLTVTFRSEVVVDPEVTVHLTRCVPPPPLPESLHWVTVALVVLAGNGLQATVGAVPPPSPDLLHWLTVAEVGVALPVMLLITSTVQVTVPPPPFPEPLHWLTVVTSDAELVVDEVQDIDEGELAAPWHSFRVTEELF